MTSQAISTKKRTVMMIVLLAGAFVALLAETFLNNAIPTIMSAFQVTQSSAQWLTMAYLLVVGLMIPLSAWIFESFNLRQNYLTMIGIFFVGSLICVFAPNFGILLTGRIIEAVAAGKKLTKSPFTAGMIAYVIVIGWDLIWDIIAIRTSGGMWIWHGYDINLNITRDALYGIPWMNYLGYSGAIVPLSMIMAANNKRFHVQDNNNRRFWFSLLII